MAESICLKCEHKYVCATGKPQPRENTTIMGCSRFVERTPFTNADRIRAMSDEEMATWISCLASIQYKIGADPHFWIDWLKADAKEK